jgi:Uroporphyrinogen decarboxylase (URO-D)
MAPAAFDVTTQDAQAMPVMPLAPADFDIARYEAHAAEAESRYVEFMRRPEGIAVWQRVRVADVFRDGCRDMTESLGWQLGGLTKAMDYLTDAPNHLEPWYGIGVTAAAFGAEYEWPEGQAPVARPRYRTVQEVPDLVARPAGQASIMRHVLAMIDYFLEETHGRVPLSWSDLQNPLNVATELVDTSGFFLGFVEAPEAVRRILAALTDEVIRFTQEQSRLIGDRLVRPGHGFASAQAGTGIGLSSDNLVMISPHAYRQFCVENDARIGAAFGGAAIHSCGDWARWAEAVKANPRLTMVDAAFTPRTDPNYNDVAAFRAAFAGTGIVVQARMVGDPDEVLARVRQLWGPGMRLIVVTYEQDPAAQHRLYRDIRALSR